MYGYSFKFLPELELYMFVLISDLETGETTIRLSLMRFWTTMASSLANRSSISGTFGVAAVGCCLFSDSKRKISKVLLHVD